ncbi:MAG: hypothetical protein ABSA67_02815 [Candidatus Brocadiia bacterium]|jgi:hypothetical protein
MGVNVALQNEDGGQIAMVLDPKSALSQALRLAEDQASQFPWASTIDLYGDTVFNRIQAEKLLKEWALLIESFSADSRTLAHLKQIDELIRQCAYEIHLYVKFIGD